MPIAEYRFQVASMDDVLNHVSPFVTNDPDEALVTARLSGKAIIDLFQHPEVGCYAVIRWSEKKCGWVAGWSSQVYRYEHVVDIKKWRRDLSKSWIARARVWLPSGCIY